jgi:hypothetical protein
MAGVLSKQMEARMKFEDLKSLAWLLLWRFSCS